MEKATRKKLAEIAGKAAQIPFHGYLEGKESNLDPVIRFFPKWTLREADGLWCAAFVYYCCREAGFEIPIRPEACKTCHLAGCVAWEEFAQGDVRIEYRIGEESFVPEAGDIVLYDRVFENREHDHMGIVHLHDADKKLDNYYLQGASDLYAEDTSYFAFERQFIMPEGHSSISLHDFALMMADVFGNNAKIAVCYLLASIYRDIITGYTTNFPLLNLFGPKGSGKSELGITLMRFFTIGDRPINLRNTTAPGLSQALATSANGMVHLDEYKNSLDMRIIEIIKGAYDGVGRSRLDMDRGKQVEKTPVDCGVIVSGQEMPTLDIAMFSRMIYLTHDTTVHDREAKDKFNRLADIRKLGLQHLTQQILSHRALFESSFYETYNEVTNEVYDIIDGEQVEDRL